MRRAEWGEEALPGWWNRMSKGPGRRKGRAGWDHLKEPKCDGVSGTWTKVTVECVGDPWMSERGVWACFSARNDLVPVLALTDH